MLFDSQPAEARAALVEVEQVSRSALDELRRILDTVRDDASSPPSPRLDHLTDLVDQVATSGIDVSLQTVGTTAPVPAAVELAAYRIVQEALTNVVKHAGPTRARVVLLHGDQALEVEVTDDGRRAPGGEPPIGEGWGLAGMRERAALVGGTVEAGPRDGGGFRVSATLPTGAGSSPAHDRGGDL